jgi:hypothetical protein
VVIPGWKNRLLTQGLRFSPRSLVTKAISKMHEGKKGSH